MFNVREKSEDVNISLFREKGSISETRLETKIKHMTWPKIVRQALGAYLMLKPSKTFPNQRIFPFRMSVAENQDPYKVTA